jgi:Neuraminidase-like domain
MPQDFKALKFDSQGDFVQDLHQELKLLDLVIPSFELEARSFKTGTKNAIMNIQKKAGLEPTGEVDEKTHIAIQNAIAMKDQKASVEGQVSFDYGLPAGKLKLRLYDHGFAGKITQLGEDITTDEQGYYQFKYDKNGPNNLEVRVVDDDEKETPLSAVLQDAQKFETLDLAAPAALGPLESEFTRLEKELGVALDDNFAALAKAKETTGSQRDISWLHQKTGWDARLIALSAIAARHTEATKIPREALYAMYRVGLPSDPALLARVDSKVVEESLKQAVKAGVSGLSDAQIAEVKKAHLGFARTSLLEAKLTGAPSSLQDMLNITDLTEPEREVVTDAFLVSQGDSEKFVSLTTGKLRPERLGVLREYGKLAALTFNNARLVQAVREVTGTAAGLEQLALKGFYKPEAWTEQVLGLLPAGPTDNPDALKAFIPEVYKAETPAKSLELYAQDMARRVRLEFPTQSVGQMVVSKEISLGPDHPADSVSAFLMKAAPLEFRLGATPVDEFARDHATALFAATDSSEMQQATLQGVKTLARVYQMTSNDRAMKVSLELGLTSAMNVVAYSQPEFLARYGLAYGSEIEALGVYRRAKQISTVTHQFFNTASAFASAIPMAATSGSSVAREEVRRDLIKKFPTLETLFGSQDYCECEHCRSVLSPAAYFVDLLLFLDPKDEPTSADPSRNVWGKTLKDWRDKHGGLPYPFRNQPEFDRWKSDPANRAAASPGSARYVTEITPFAALRKRRPDLEYLPLTCENTNTEVPYIDLVNEILEAYVARSTLDRTDAHDTGAIPSEDLLAEPQRVRWDAYTILRDQSVYPLTLPFDYGLEVVRQFLMFAKVPYWKVMETVRSTEDLFTRDGTARTTHTWSETLAESLGISPAEYAIYTQTGVGNPPDDWYRLYGYTADAEALNGLWFAKILSRRLGVTYKQLLELVTTWFINPNLKLLNTLRELKLEVSQVFAYKDARFTPAMTTIERADFERKLDAGTKPSFNARTWLDEAWTRKDFDSLLVLHDTDPSCNFETTKFQLANRKPAGANNLHRLNLLVRLWKKLGWTLEETDQALRVLMPRMDGTVNTPNLLGTAFKTALVLLGHFKMLDDQLKVGKNNRIKLLALWADLTSVGRTPLYAQLLLKPGVLKDDPIFDHPLGNYLEGVTATIKDHLTALQGAFNLTNAEIELILQDTNTTVNATLSIPMVSNLYRYGLLAKALKLSVADLITLKGLMGIDPFAKPQGTVLDFNALMYPVKQTLEFVRLVRLFKDSGFRVADLDYLLRHQFAQDSKYRLDFAAFMKLLKGISAEVTRIQLEHATPVSDAELDGFTSMILQQKLQLILPADVASRFVAMFDGTAEFEVQRKVTTGPALAEADFQNEPSVRVRFDPVRKLQFVTFKGVVTNQRSDQLAIKYPKLKALPNLANTSDTADLLEEAHRTALAFLQKHFVSNDLLANSRDTSVDLENLASTLFSTDTSLPTADQVRELRAKRKLIAAKIMPQLRKRLLEQQMVQMLTTQYSSQPEITQALISKIELLQKNSSPLVNIFSNANARGVQVQYFSDAAHTTKTGPAALLPAISTTNATVRPSNARSAIFEGHLEVPQSGTYRFFVDLKNAASNAELRIGEGPEALVKMNAVIAADNDTDLKAGIAYPFRFTVGGLETGNAEVTVQGDTLPRDSLEQLVLYPKSMTDELQDAFVLLGKSLQMIQVLGFAEREVRTLLQAPPPVNPENRLGFDLNALPTMKTNIAAATRTSFIRLCEYLQLKKEMGASGDELMDLLERSKRTDRSALPSFDEDFNTLLAQITQQTVQEIADARQSLNFRTNTATVGANTTKTVQGLGNEQGLWRLWNLVKLTHKLGVTPQELNTWTNPGTGPTAAANQMRDRALAVRNSIRARYDESWNRVAPNIFNPLRQRKRDALVAHLLHKLDLERLEQLFEFFLIDPGMEPVVRTSRLRLAISSVQTFIQRCLLNLELEVNPQVINAEHWKWMKRYRVWEANRKIFLYPENWLEPEFRDDKSPLFKTLEGALLQGDVSRDLVEEALNTYLTGLEKIARLDIVSTYAEQDPIESRNNVMHVLGRTAQEPHEYFYHRFQERIWSAWEPVNAPITGTMKQIIIAVWRGRVHVFWISVVEEGVANADLEVAGTISGIRDDASNATTARLMATAATGASQQVDLKARLSFAEYTHGKWVGHKSSVDVDAAIKIAKQPKNSANSVVISGFSSGIDSNEIQIKIASEWGDIKHIANFRLLGKNSPVLTDILTNPQSLVGFSPYFVGSEFNNDVNINFMGKTNYQSRKNSILDSENIDSLTLASNLTSYLDHESQLAIPFFVFNERMTYFLEPTVTDTVFQDPILYVPAAIRKSPTITEIKPWVAAMPPRTLLDRVGPIATSKFDWVVNPSIFVSVDSVFLGATGILTDLKTATDGADIGSIKVLSPQGVIPLRGMDEIASLTETRLR